MYNQQSIVDQIVQNLAFDVEAVPKKDLIQTTRISQSTPLNVKIKVRKKDEIHNMQHDIASVADNTSRTKQKIRLVNTNSDQTIMTFDVFMEAEFEKKPARKLRKHIFDTLRPGICLGAVDDDEYPYMPNSSYSANITEPSVATKSNGTLKQTFTLTKNVYQDYSVSTQPEGQKWLFGKCKPGGCLDPPFGEDKYSYKPSTRSGPERAEEQLEAEDVGTAVDSNKKPITLHDEETQSNGRHSSVFESGLFKKKRKYSDNSTSTKIPDKTDSIVDIYQKESATNSVSTHSNPIITYPPKIKTDPRISDDKTARSRGPSEEKSRRSFNDHSEPYFVPPKGVQRIKDKDTLDPNDKPKHRSSDVRNLLKESFKMPVPLPIPIPIPTISSKRTPEVTATNDDILKKDSIPGQKLQNQELLDHELQDQKPQNTIKLKDTEIPLLLRTKSASGDTDDEPKESSKKETSIPSNVKQPTASNEIDDQNFNEIKSEPLEVKENNIKDNSQPNQQKKRESFKMPLPIPVPVPPSFKFSDSNRADAADTLFESSKDMQQSIDPGSGENESVAKTIPNLEYTNIEGDEIPEKYLRTRGGFTEQESDTEISVTLDSIMDTKRDSDGEKTPDKIETPEKQKDIRDNVTIPTKYAQEDANPGLESRFGGESITDGIEKPSEQKNTQENIKRDFKGIEKPEEQQKNIKAITEEDIKRVSNEGAITDGIEKPSEKKDTQEDMKRDFEGVEKAEEQQENIKAITEEDIKRVYKEEAITDGIEKLSEQKDTQEDMKHDFEGIEKPEEQQENIEAITEGDTKRVSKKETVTDRMEIPAKPDEIKDKITTSAIYTEEEIIQDSEGEKIIDPKEQKDIKDKATIPTKYAGDRSDVYGKDEKRSSLTSEPEYETETGDSEMSKPHRNKEYETTKPKKDDNIDSYTGGQTRYTSEGAMDIIAAPVIIDYNTEPTSKLKPVKEVYSETNLSSGVPITTQIASRFKKFDDENDDLQNTLSQELIGPKSVVYDSDGFVPSTSTKIHAERTSSYDKRVILPEDTVLSSILSIGTLKSAMKKDTISIDLGFHSYLNNNNNEIIIQTFDSAKAPKRLPNDSVTVIKSQIRLSSNEIRIPVDSEHDMSIQIKKANANQRVSISEPRLLNVIDTGKTNKQLSPEQYSDVEMRSFEPKAEGTKDNINGIEASADRFLDYYEKELVPLQLTIKNLRDEIDFLATQQSLFRDKLYCPNKSKLPRLVHSNKKCFGCAKK